MLYQVVDKLYAAHLALLIVLLAKLALRRVHHVLVKNVTHLVSTFLANLPLCVLINNELAED